MTGAVQPSDPSSVLDGGAVVHVPAAAAGLLTPSLCACCLEPGGDSQRLESNGGPSVLVHYCSECLPHAAAARTRSMAVGFAAGLVGLGTALALVLAAGALAVPLQALVVAGAALLPGLALLRGSPRGRHTARGPAAWWRFRRREGWGLMCTHPAWAARVAHMSEARWSKTPRRPVPWPGPLFLVAGLAALTVPALNASLGVQIRILNRHPTDAIVVVDGRHRGMVRPSAAESATAGLQLRLVAGQRHISLVGKDGQVLADQTVRLSLGVDHLLAVSPDPVCFWLERTAYGRARTADLVREPLAGSGPHFALPGTIDSWFRPNPPSNQGDGISSGGALLALRQGRCQEPGQSVGRAP